jgi:hypothetical protein
MKEDIVSMASSAPSSCQPVTTSRARCARSLAGNLFIGTWRHRFAMRGIGCYARYILKDAGLRTGRRANATHRRPFQLGLDHRSGT